MKDDACVSFLQWALPHLHMRWPGFRKVRGQVCKRLARRLQQLELADLDQYQDYLTLHQDEWSVLDSLCQVTVSRFYRDKMMFSFLADQVLPQLAEQAIARKQTVIKVWCIGCASGEEPYSVGLVWQFECQSRFPQLQLEIVATETKARLLERMQQACYQYATVKNLPAEWRDKAFNQRAELYCLKPAYQGNIQPLMQDIRETLPEQNFDLILCRNLVFTYYEAALQRKILLRLQQHLRVGGGLVLGVHEQLPDGMTGLETWSDKLRIYRKSSKRYLNNKE